MAMTLRADKGSILSWNEMDANFKACMGVHNLLHVQDRRDLGTNSGQFGASAWRTRILNTTVINGIPGASLSANQIILPSGTYFCEGSAPAVYANSNATTQKHKTRLFDVTNNVSLIDGSLGLQYRSANGSHIETRSFISGAFSLSSGSTRVELQHYSTHTDAYNTGFGNRSNIGTYELYSDLKIWKVA